MEPERADVVVVGGGVAGLMAATYTARHDFETRVFDSGDSILRRNAHLENVPGFPAGVDARLWLSMLREQAEGAGATVTDGTVTRVTEDDTFVVETDERTVRAPRVVLATKNELSYLDVPGVDVVETGKTFVETDERGRTGVEGLYAAGRLAGKPHQAVVAAGHGAEIAVTLLEDADVGFYHDWVTPEGYFSGRDRDVPPGCAEIDDEEWTARQEASRAVMRERFAEPYPESPEQHPSVTDE